MIKKVIAFTLVFNTIISAKSDEHHFELHSVLPDGADNSSKYYVQILIKELTSTTNFIEARAIFSIYRDDKTIICKIHEFNARSGDADFKGVYREKDFTLKGEFTENTFSSLIIDEGIKHKDVVSDVFSTVINNYYLFKLPVNYNYEDDLKWNRERRPDKFSSAFPNYSIISAKILDEEKSLYEFIFQGDYVLKSGGNTVISHANKQVIFDKVNGEVVSLVKTFYFREGGVFNKILTCQLRLIK